MSPRSEGIVMPPAGRGRAGMNLALQLARRGPRGANPLVGAVIMAPNGTVLATGYHQGAGTPHAEADALNRLGPITRAEARELSMFVTLEPCNHVGRTGACARAIIDSGIGRVCYAVPDETDRAAGGAAALVAAGIRVEEGLLGAEAREMNHRWFAARAAGRPFTTLHIAQTLDGRIAAADGSSQWITGAESRNHSHLTRARAEAIIIGTGTLLADDPQLTARTPDGTEARHQPRRIVMGYRPIPAGAALRGDGNFAHMPTHDPHEVLTGLAATGIDHAMIEGGASIATAFLAADLIDEIWLYQAPMMLGGGRSAVGDLGIQTLADARRYRLDESGGDALLRLGPDIALHLEPLPAAETIFTGPTPASAPHGA